jgi:hypothetical protein
VFKEELNSNEIGSDLVYELPKSKIYEAIDSFIRNASAMFQMTGARSHPCKQEGVRRVVELMGNPDAPKLYFVVPKNRFRYFSHQKYEDANGKKIAYPTNINVKEVKQYVLSLDETSQ